MSLQLQEPLGVSSVTAHLNERAQLTRSAAGRTWRPVVFYVHSQDLHEGLRFYSLPPFVAIASWYQEKLSFLMRLPVPFPSSSRST